MFFKKKKKIVKPNFSKYQFKINLKSLMLFEKLSGKSYFKVTEADTLMLIYCILIINNPTLIMTFDTFKMLIKDNSVMKWLYEELTKQFNVISQFTITEQKQNGEQKSDETTITDIVGSLIAYGMDAHYVMYDMDIWEMENLNKSLGEKRENDMEMDRLWTYLTILPHIDGKKLKGPEKLLPFPWEKDKRAEQAKKGLEEKKDMIAKILGGHKNEG